MHSPELGYLKNVHRSVLDSLTSAVRHIESKDYPTVLQDCKKVSGALHLARFEGAARLIDDIIQFVVIMKDGGEIDAKVGSPVEVVQKALLSVKQYVLDALANAPDVPMKLWDSYRLLRFGRKVGAHPSQLFFPEMNVKVWPAQNQGHSLDINWLKEQRNAFSGGLVPWVKDQSQLTTLSASKKALETILGKAPLTSGFVGFLTASIAALEVIIHKEKADQFDRIVLAKVDTELRAMGDGKSLPDEETWRFMLYIVACGSHKSDAINKVKANHHLIEYFNLIKEEATRQGRTLDDAALSPIKESLSNVKEVWSKVTQGFSSVMELEKPVGSLSERLGEFNHPAIRRLGEALLQLSNGMRAGKVKLNDALSEEIASMLMLVEQAVEAKGRVSTQYEKLVLSQIQRTLAAVKGDTAQLAALPVTGIDEESVNRSGRSLKAEVINQVLADITSAEESLDAWFRNEEQESKEEAMLMAKPLRRLVAILHMAQMPEASQVLGEVLLGLEIVLGKGKAGATDDERANVSNKMAALALYLNAEMSEQANAKEFLGIKIESRPHVSAIPAPVEVKPAKEVIAIEIVEPVIVEKSSQIDKIVQKDSAKIKSIEEKSVTGVDKVTDDEMLECYLEDFNEQLKTMKQGGMMISRDLKNREALAEIRRSFHTLKGSGRMVGGLVCLPNVAERIELFLKKWVGEEKDGTPQLVSAVEEAINMFEGWRDELTRTKQVTIDGADLVEKFEPSQYPEYAEYHQAQAAPEAVVVAEVQPSEPVVLALKVEPLEVVESKLEVVPVKAVERSPNVFVGDIVVERELYEMYVAEAGESTTLMVREWEKVISSPNRQVTKALMGAGHKLGSSSRTVGFGELAEVSYLVERWTERHLEGGSWVSEKAAEDMSGLIKHVKELYQCVVDKEQLVLDRELVKKVESALEQLRNHSEPGNNSTTPVWAQESSEENAAFKEKLRKTLDDEIQAVRKHLGALEAMRMIVGDE